jgi:hypothetical protein
VKQRGSQIAPHCLSQAPQELLKAAACE